MPTPKSRSDLEKMNIVYNVSNGETSKVIICGKPLLQIVRHYRIILIKSVSLIFLLLERISFMNLT